MDYVNAKKFFDELYLNFDGYSISSKAKSKQMKYDKSFIYGEIIPETFYEILDECKPKPGEIFYDLGSGTGKAVVLASLIFGFAKSIGIEFLEDLFLASKDISFGLNNLLNATILLDFVKADYLDYNFSDGDVIFAHCTCHSESQMIMLSEKLEILKRGTRVITVTRTLFSNMFNLKKSEDFQMGWGMATVNFYEKIM